MKKVLHCIFILILNIYICCSYYLFDIVFLYSLRASWRRCSSYFRSCKPTYSWYSCEHCCAIRYTAHRVCLAGKWRIRRKKEDSKSNDHKRISCQWASQSGQSLLKRYTVISQNSRILKEMFNSASNDSIYWFIWWFLSEYPINRIKRSLRF